ncbi:glycoside hydrolase family 6 protein [Aeromicrobium sp. IC_218]|uniref:glycoside hydrolase family 6 protein n=1 Tax=Aeromicrobium sp. IC_218 TaxID=2545468 RepID=UPI00103CE582|nr:glycoside hydrolase family 6 protein [Aeromicrobium sp. IC_218]TCI98969.1 hypothetical protein E0W78_09510 [Aeromicrobium sp. IC_218]
MSPSPAPRRLRRALLSTVPTALAGVALVVATLAATGPRLAPVAFADPSSPDPFAGTVPWVDPYSDAARAAAAEPDPWRRAMLEKVARGGSADWIGDWTPTPRQTVAQRVTQVTATGAVPVLVAYNIPQRDCGLYSAGGAHSAAAYKAWIDEVAAGIGSRKAAVVLEPDALASIDCLSATDQARRYQLLSYAVTAFGRYPAIATYLDAGNAGWQPAFVMADRLKKANVASARGVALNVSNFGWTTDNIAYARDLSARTGGKKAVIDTSRNGLGPAEGFEHWCNPPERALGPLPLTPVPDDVVDALLWIKVPGQSDGECSRAEPSAGTFWADYAIGLAARAAY